MKWNHFLNQRWGNGRSCSLTATLVACVRMTRLIGLVLLGCGVTTLVPAGAVPSSGEIVLGMSTVLSGPTADLGLNMREGVLAGLERANRVGGVQGRKLRLIALDDGYEPARTAPNMRRLLEQEQVLAVIGSVGTPTSVAAIPIATEQKTLYFAPFTGAGVLRKAPPERYVINYRASYTEEIGAIIDALIERGGLTVADIALFTQRDTYGDAGYASFLTAMKRHGLNEAQQFLHLRYDRNTLAVEDAVANLLFAPCPPKAVVMVGAYAPCAKFIKLALESGLDAVFHNVSFVGSESLAAELGNIPARVLVTQVVPPLSATNLAIVRDYLADQRKLESPRAPSYGALEGYVAARILVLALERVAGAPTRKNIVAVLEGLGEFDLGLGEPLKLSPHEHQASHRVWLTCLSGGGFEPLSWENVAAVVRNGGAP